MRDKRKGLASLLKALLDMEYNVNYNAENNDQRLIKQWELGYNKCLRDIANLFGGEIEG